MRNKIIPKGEHGFINGVVLAVLNNGTQMIQKGEHLSLPLLVSERL